MSVVRVRLIGAAVIATALCLAFVGSALAQTPAWTISAFANTTVAAGDQVQYQLEFQNIGDVDSTAPGDPACDPNGPPLDPACVRLVVTVPAGITATDVEAQNASSFNDSACTGLGVPGPTVLTCGSSVVVGTLPHQDGTRTLVLSATVDSAASGTLTSSFSVSGGGAADSASTVDPIRVSPSPPGFGVAAFDGLVSDAGGGAYTQAGGHPHEASVSTDFNTLQNPNPLIGAAWPVEPTKDVLVDLPAGVIGDPTVADQCTTPDLSQSTIPPLCSPSSQVGTALVRVNAAGANNLLGPIPVYSMVPPPDAAARFGFNVAGSVVMLDAQVRSATDYGVSIHVNNVSEGLDAAGTTVTLWGVPADSSHDSERACAGLRPRWQGGTSCPAGTPLRAFLRNPTTCAAPAGSPVSDGLVTGVSMDSWANPGRRNADGSADVSDPAWQQSSFVSHLLPGYPSPPSDWGAHQLPTGCDQVPFDPSLTAVPDTAGTNTASGFTFDVNVPQSDDPNAIGEGDLKKAVVTLPEGVRVSPGSADGLQGCSPAQVGLHSTADASCPDGSKLGSLTITTPLLAKPLKGGIYLATPHDNPFNSLIAIYLVAKGPGFSVKVPGKVELDPVSGQATATFDNNPQTPFTNLHLEFLGGPRAPLATPAACGQYTTTSTLTSWSGKTVVSKSAFTLDRNSDGTACAPARFAPTMTAGTLDPTIGTESPFVLTLARGDRDQEFRSLVVDMPSGLTGRLAATVPCSNAAANAGTCQDISKIGSVTVGAGPGPNPFFITTGRAYITDGYKGAKLGLAFVVPAVAGPFDLGNVVVRAALFVDRATARLRVASDPLPTVLQGIPLQVRLVQVLIDRPHFFINPDSCATKQIVATATSTEGAVAHMSSRFRATDCSSKTHASAPALSVGSKHHTAAGVTTPFTATLTQKPGQSNLRSVRVSLPTTLNARLPVVNRACTLVAFEAGHCTSRARAGSAVVVTPLLRDPLRGSAYFVKNPKRALPDLMIAFRGQIDIDVTGKVTIPGGTRLATSFDTIPDVPITKFTLHIVSGKNGPLGVVTNLCTARARAATAAIGVRSQNGDLLRTNQRLHINGCSKVKKAGR